MNRVLRDVYRECDRQAILVHGACPKGADAMADELWKAKVGEEFIERYPAQWTVNGKKDWEAGFKRNQQMVDTKPDIVLAFQTPCVKTSCHEDSWHYSHGTQHTIDAALDAGLDVRIFRDPPF
jgi:hypothetical protein